MKGLYQIHLQKSLLAKGRGLRFKSDNRLAPEPYPQLIDSMIQSIPAKMPRSVFERDRGAPSLQKSQLIDGQMRRNRSDTRSGTGSHKTLLANDEIHRYEPSQTNRFGEDLRKVEASLPSKNHA